MLLGPPGWLALIVVLMLFSTGTSRSGSPRRRPRSPASGRSGLRLGAFLAAPLVALYPGMFSTLWFGLAASLLVAGLFLHLLVSREAVRFTLDASRRWVTLFGVHPAFVQAVEEREALATAGDR